MRLALVTGAASGLGLATARRLAADGMRVVVSDLDQQACEAVAQSLDGQGHAGLRLDVSAEEEVAGTFARIEAEIAPVDVLAHFAGTLGRGGMASGIRLIHTTVEEWEAVNRVNALGTFLCLREYARCRSERPVEHGRVIAVTSVVAQTGGLQSGAAYSASKGAVLGLVRTAARDLAEAGITVNCISPGAIDTPMLAKATGEAEGGTKYRMLDAIPLRRVGGPEEVAAAAAYLASIDAGYVTGATLDVNGGLFIG